MKALVGVFLAACSSSTIPGSAEPIDVTGTWADEKSQSVEVQVTSGGQFQYQHQSGERGSGQVFASRTAYRAPNGARKPINGRLVGPDPSSVRIEWEDGRVWRRRSLPSQPVPPPVVWDAGSLPPPQYACNQVPAIPGRLVHRATANEVVVMPSALGAAAHIPVVKGVNLIIQASSSSPPTVESLLEGPTAHPQGLARLAGRWVFSHSSQYAMGLIGVCRSGGCNWVRINSDHPGGIQACGDIVVVSSKDGTYILDVERMRPTQNRLAGPGEAAGVAYHPEHNRHFLMTARSEALYASACTDLQRCGFGAGTKVPRDDTKPVIELAASWDTGGINLFFSEHDQQMYVAGFETEGSKNLLVVQRLVIERVTPDSVPWQRTKFKYSLGPENRIEIFESPTPLHPTFRNAGYVDVVQRDGRIYLDTVGAPRQFDPAAGYIMRRASFEVVAPAE